MADDIFKIKKLDGTYIASEDKRKTLSKFNAAKHFKTANIPALCDQCVYRSIETGGNGKCPKYEKGAVCSIREDFVKFINDLNSKIVVTEESKFDKSGDIESIFRQIKAQKTGGGE